MTNPGGDSFLTAAELGMVGFAALGEDVRVSRFARVYSPGRIRLGSHVRIDDFCILSGGAGLTVGDYVHVAAYCALYAAEGITLGDFSGLSARVTIYTASDDYSGESLTNPTVPDEFKPRLDRGAVAVGRHAIVGVNSTIMPGVSVGLGAAVGAHSFVTKNCDPWSVYFGSPAKRIGTRSQGLLRLEGQLKARDSGSRE